MPATDESYSNVHDTRVSELELSIEEFLHQERAYRDYDGEDLYQTCLRHIDAFHHIVDVVQNFCHHGTDHVNRQPLYISISINIYVRMI